MSDTPTEPQHAAAPEGETAAELRSAAQRRRRIFGVEVVIVTLLGIASVATAYASFQSSLYDSHMASSYTQGQNARTEAESLYLEANQQYFQDSQTFQQIVLLGVELESTDPAIAEAAGLKLERLYFVAVDDVFADAIDWSNSENDANPEVYTDPQTSDDYLDARYGAYYDRAAESQAHVEAGDQANRFGDQLTLYTVLLAIALFLLGIAAVVGSALVKHVLIAIGAVITVVSIVLTALVPFVAVG